MAELDALLMEVLANPTDDAPRLAYAAAIEATDPLRAELIRVQIQLYRWRQTHAEPPERAALTIRETALVSDYGPAWGANLRGMIDRRVFGRGFVDWIWLDADKFVATAAELYKRAPILHLDLARTRPVAKALFGSPALARIRSLSLFGNGLTDAEAIELASSPHLGNLTWLDLGNNLIGAPGLEAIAASKKLPRLRYLGFQHNKVADPTPQADGTIAAPDVAAAIVRKHGARPWLDPQPGAAGPPARDVDL
jgi:uncharacterized protein (TIGR02996 family)